MVTVVNDNGVFAEKLKHFCYVSDSQFEGLKLESRPKLVQIINSFLIHGFLVVLKTAIKAVYFVVFALLNLYECI